MLSSHSWMSLPTRSLETVRKDVGDAPAFFEPQICERDLTPLREHQGLIHWAPAIPYLSPQSKTLLLTELRVQLQEQEQSSKNVLKNKTGFSDWVVPLAEDCTI